MRNKIHLSTLFILASTLSCGVGSEDLEISTQAARPGGGAGGGGSTSLAPSNLSATPLSSSSMELTWQDNSTDEKEFRVYVSTPDTLSLNPRVVLAPNTTRTTVTGLNPCTAYVFRVDACTRKTCAGVSITASTLGAPPAPPMDLAAASVSASQLDLTWSDVEGETGYVVERSLDGAAFSEVAQLSGGASSYLDLALSPSTTYSYRVGAHGCGLVAYSNVASARTEATIIELASGDAHSLALDSDGNVHSWGLNSTCQLGRTTTTLSPATQPALVEALSEVVEVAGGLGFSLALRRDGTVWSWGGNSQGQLGMGDTLVRCRATQIPGLSGIVALATGGAGAYALDAEGQVYGWGNNNQGQLGDGTLVTRLAPVLAQNMPANVIGITAGGGHVHYLTAEGLVYSRGYPVLGNGVDLVRALDPVAVVTRNADGTIGLPIAGIVQIVAAHDHVVLRHSSGAIYGFGGNAAGELGGEGGSNTARSIPTLGSDNVDVHAGVFKTMVVKTDGRVFGIGQNSRGGLGIGTADALQHPTAVEAQVSGVTRLVRGFTNQYTLFLRADGRVFGSGYNFYGQLGNGLTSDSASPVQTLNLP